MEMINSVKTSSIISSILYQSNFIDKTSGFIFIINPISRNEKKCAIQEDEVRGVCSRASSSSSSPSLEPGDDSDSHLSVYKVPVMIVARWFNPCKKNVTMTTFSNR